MTSRAPDLIERRPNLVARPWRTDPWSGLAQLLGLTLRRDRFRLPVWIFGLVAWELLMVTSFTGLYPSATDRAGYAVTIDNPGSTFLIGGIYRASDYTNGVITGHQTMVLLSIAAALMGISTVVRHTRAEEESGRVEMLRAAQVGRYAPLTSAVLIAVVAQLVLSVVLALGLLALGEDSIDAVGTVLFACSVAAAGLVFTGVAALAVQLVGTARAASGLCALVLAAAFLMRGVGDVADSYLSWLSPLGWSQRTYPWDTNDWSPLTLSLLTATVLLLLAAWLSTRRDLGAALVGGRAGRSAASVALATPLGFALRLNRANATGWAVGLFVFGLVYGPVLRDAEAFIEQMPVLADFNPDAAGGGGLSLFASIVVGFAALLVTIPAVQVITRMNKDEQAGRTQTLLAGPVSRTRWYFVTVTVALLTAVAVMLAFAFGFGLSASSAVNDADLVADILLAGFGYLPAVAVVVALASALVGWSPRALGLVWLLLIWAVVVFYFAELLDWPDWATTISPFDHVAPRPAQHDDTPQLLGLGVVAVALLMVGLVGYRHRAIR